MNSELDRTYNPFDDPSNEGANREFEQWLDEVIMANPEIIAAEAAYWEREAMKMEDLGDF